MSTGPSSDVGDMDFAGVKTVPAARPERRHDKQAMVFVKSFQFLHCYCGNMQGPRPYLHHSPSGETMARPRWLSKVPCPAEL
jgi:hypothetical protein